MEEVGEGLAGGKPLLGHGKVIPTSVADVPGHLRCDLIGGLLVTREDVDDFLCPDPMVLLEFLDSPTVIRNGIAMSRKGQPNLVGGDLRQTCQEVSERVGCGPPARDVGSDAVENVVP
jgi:hypothetical protein